MLLVPMTLQTRTDQNLALHPYITHLDSEVNGGYIVQCSPHKWMKIDCSLDS